MLNTLLVVHKNLSGSDFSIFPSTLSFGPNDTSKRITIVAVDDNVLEYNESVAINFKNVDQLLDIGVLLGDINDMTIFIIDNDGKDLIPYTNNSNSNNNINNNFRSSIVSG